MGVTEQPSNPHDEYWMRKAFSLALKAQENDEVPVGAILVSANNIKLAQAFNEVRQTNDPSAHAEILAIRRACLAQKNYRIPNTTLYVTLEPCCMCAGALVQARIARLVFATRDQLAGAAVSAYNLLQGYPLNHKVAVTEGILQAESSELIINFFKHRRIKR